MTNRVEIPAYTDRWMMGDRYGTIVKVSRQRPSKAVRASLLTKHPHAWHEIAHVQLDKSGKTVLVVFDDCREV